MSTFRDKKPPTRTFLELYHAFPKKVVRGEGVKYLIAVQCIIAKPFETVEEHKGGKKIIIKTTWKEMGKIKTDFVQLGELEK